MWQNGSPDRRNLTIVKRKSDPESRRRRARELMRWRGPLSTINYRPVLSSEKLINNKSSVV
jgi:hypothetical protein